MNNNVDSQCTSTDDMSTIPSHLRDNTTVTSSPTTNDPSHHEHMGTLEPVISLKPIDYRDDTTFFLKEMKFGLFGSDLQVSRPHQHRPTPPPSTETIIRNHGLLRDEVDHNNIKTNNNNNNLNTEHDSPSASQLLSNYPTSSGSSGGSDDDNTGSNTPKSRLNYSTQEAPLVIAPQSQSRSSSPPFKLSPLPSSASAATHARHTLRNDHKIERLRASPVNFMTEGQQQQTTVMPMRHHNTHSHTHTHFHLHHHYPYPQVRHRQQNQDNTVQQQHTVVVPRLAATAEVSPMQQRQKSDQESEVKGFVNDGPWTPDEHTRFLEGIKECGSNWKQIAEEFVRTRTRLQVSSYAQKYMKGRSGNPGIVRARTRTKVPDQNQNL